MITFDDMPTAASTCPICGGDVPKDESHMCVGFQPSPLQQPVPLSLDSEILAELKEIRSVLEVMKETLRLIRHKN